MRRIIARGRCHHAGDMGDIVDRLERVIRRHILDAIPSADRAKLRSAALDDLLIEYCVWRGRFVAPLPRHVHRSPELMADAKATEHRTALETIQTALRRGADINPYLSRGLKRIGRDRLLADWGIHHLHLSTTLEPDGFVKRTGDVLFAAVTDSDAFLLGIYDHPRHANWAAEEIFAVLVRNWPDSGLVIQMQGVVRLTKAPSDEERRQLRNAGVASIMQIEGKVYVPAQIGMTTAGTPMAATRGAHALMRALDDWRRSDAHEQLRQIEGVPETSYWAPAVHIALRGFEEYAGFQAGPTFVPAGRIC